MNNTFPQFNHAVEELSAYIFRANTFIISLTNKQIVRHTTEEPDKFRDWLVHHRIKDLTEQTGTLILNFYFSN